MDVEDSRTTEHPWKDTVDKESEPKIEAMWTTNDNAIGMTLNKLCLAHFMTSYVTDSLYKVMGISVGHVEFLVLLHSDSALLFSYSSLSLWECLSYAFVPWKSFLLFFLLCGLTAKSFL